MTQCFICDDGKLVRTASKTGPEIYCNSCRRVVLSSYLGFNITANEIESLIEPCSVDTEQGIKPGWKGPGDKARCNIFDPSIRGDKTVPGSEASAIARAKDTVYAYRHRSAASKIVNAVAYFSGAPAAVVPPTTSSQDLAATGPNPAPPSTKPQDFAATDQSSIGQATAPGGMQPGDLNSNNPLNSGTTASRRLAELLSEELGPSVCTEHMMHDECNHSRKSQ
jgi:hypothetical protein